MFHRINHILFYRRDTDQATASCHDNDNDVEMKVMIPPCGGSGGSKQSHQGNIIPTEDPDEFDTDDDTSIFDMNRTIHHELDRNMDLDDGSICRYCFNQVQEHENYSACACQSALCRECLQRELRLTESREDHVLRCTVCRSQYDIQHVDTSPFACLFQIIFTTFCCTALHFQGNRIPSATKKFALFSIWWFIAAYTFGISYIVLKISGTIWSPFSIKSIVVVILLIMDSCVAASYLWFLFTELRETLGLTIPFVIFWLHAARTAVVAYYRIGLNNVQNMRQRVP